MFGLSVCLILAVYLLILASWEERCYNGGGKHNSNARYTEKEYDNGTSYTKTDEPAFTRIYIHDVCKWCGQTTKENK